MNSICSQDSTHCSYFHMPPICHCFNHFPKINAAPEHFEVKKNSVQFNETPNAESFDISKPIFTAQNHVLKVKSDDNKEECKLELLDERQNLKSNNIETNIFKIIRKGKKDNFDLICYVA